MKLPGFLLFSFSLHLVAVFLLRSASHPISIESLNQEFEILEVLPQSKTSSVAPAKRKVVPVTKKDSSTTPLKEAPETSDRPENSSESSDALDGAGSGPFSVGSVTVAPRVLKEKKVPYPRKAAREGVEGIVEVQLVINTQGLVESAEVIRGPAPVLNEAAVAALKEFVFSPAKVGEKTVPVRLIYKYRFGSGG